MRTSARKRAAGGGRGAVGATGGSTEKSVAAKRTMAKAVAKVDERSGRRRKGAGAMSAAGRDEERRVTTGEAGAAGAARAKPPAREALEIENISKVRDILVGPQFRETEKRLTRLEQRLATEVSNIWGEATKRFDSVENYIKKDAEAFSGQLAREQGDRAESLKELSQKLQETTNSLQRLRDEVATMQRQLQQQLLDQSKTLRDESRQQNEAISAALDRAVQELRAEKTDRVALAALFAEVSARLTETLEISFGTRSEE